MIVDTASSVVIANTRASPIPTNNQTVSRRRLARPPRRTSTRNPSVCTGVGVIVVKFVVLLFVLVQASCSTVLPAAVAVAATTMLLLRSVRSRVGRNSVAGGCPLLVAIVIGKLSTARLPVPVEPSGLRSTAKNTEKTTTRMTRPTAEDIAATAADDAIDAAALPPIPSFFRWSREHRAVIVVVIRVDYVCPRLPGVFLDILPAFVPSLLETIGVYY